MASLPIIETQSTAPPRYLSGLSNPARAIGGVNFDALLLWGIPLISLLFVMSWVNVAAILPDAVATRMFVMLSTFSVTITFAHLFAVIPRAYLNGEVFSANRFKLTVVPVLLIAGLIYSPAVFAIGGMAAVFWDVHHSAMQNFGLARIYDMKAGNDAELLRKVDLRLNWVLYVGPLAAGSSLMLHLHALDRLTDAGLMQIARLPGVLQGQTPIITGIAVTAWFATIGWAASAYRTAYKAGYRMPVHKAALICSTGLVSLIAYGFSSPAVALISINIYHAIQYFALVWLKEGSRMTALTGVKGVMGVILFCGLCEAAGVGYSMATATKVQWIVAPFIACSLLHFWFDSFVWSVRKKQV
jgi:hypothetical protein